MSSSLPEAFGIALGGLLSVGAPTAVFVLMSTEDGGVRKAGAFALGFVMSYGALGFLAILAGDSMQATARMLKSGGIAYLVLAMIFTLLAVLTLRKASEPDRPNLADRLEGLSAWRTLGAGLVVPIMNLKSLPIFLAAVATLAHEPFGTALTFLPLLVCLFCFNTIAPPLLAIAAPEASKPLLDRTGAWIDKHGFVLSVVAMAGFAVVFGIKGGLMLLG